jgi:hypothetical protein
MAKRARQVERVREALEEQKEEARVEAEQDERLGRDRPQDEPDPHTKSSEREEKPEREKKQ